jgi:hypothetical protein
MTKRHAPGTALGAPLPSAIRALKVVGLAEQLHLDSAGGKELVSFREEHRTTARKVVGLGYLKEVGKAFARGVSMGKLRMRVDDYVANNPTLYDAAYAGFIAGAYFSKELTSASESLYEGIVGQAILYAQALDTAIPAGSPVTGQATFIGNLSQSVFANKYSVDLPESAFVVYASAIAALYEEAASGFVQSGGGGGGVTTPQYITRSSSLQIVCSGQDQTVNVDTAGSEELLTVIAPPMADLADGQAFGVEDGNQSWGASAPDVSFESGVSVQDPQNPSSAFLAGPVSVRMMNLNGSSAWWVLLKEIGVWKLQ